MPRACCWRRPRTDLDSPVYTKEVVPENLHLGNIPIDKDTENEKKPKTEIEDSGDIDGEGNPRNKCALAPGHSLMDWIRLGQSGRDLTGLGRRAGTLTVSPKQLATHCTQDDAWLAIRGKVYNVTHYMDFHPGGKDELMKGVGKDATDMFNEVHAWVNYESILAKCLIGRLCSLESDIDATALFYGPSASSPSPIATSGVSMVTALDLTNGRVVQQPENLKFDWIQKMEYITTIFYTKPYSNPQVQISSPSKENTLNISVFHSNNLYTNELHFQHDIHWPCRVSLNQETGKIEIKFRKILSKIWDNYGFIKQSCTKAPSPEEAAEDRIKYVIMHKIQINHNTWLISLQRVDGVKQTVPIGWHVRVHSSINGQPIARSYTPITPSILLSFLSKPTPFLSTNSTPPMPPTPILPPPKPTPSMIPTLSSSPPNKIPINTSSKTEDTATETYQGDVILLVKSYKEGMLTPWLCSRVKGDVIELSAPLGSFRLDILENVEMIILLAAGSGITPMLKLIEFLLLRRQTKCQKITLMFFNRKEEDILCKEYLENLKKEDSRFKVEYILSNPDTDWTGQKGHVNSDMIKKTVYEMVEDSHLLPNEVFATICGPTVFTNVVKSMLTDLGFLSNRIHPFQG